METLLSGWRLQRDHASQRRGVEKLLRNRHGRACRHHCRLSSDPRKRPRHDRLCARKLQDRNTGHPANCRPLQEVRQRAEDENVTVLHKPLRPAALRSMLSLFHHARQDGASTQGSTR
ncbi:hypothetical protein VXQ18_11845 [Brucella abortus]|nr:hypothetical protein [Brucella abortus]